MKGIAITMGANSTGFAIDLSGSASGALGAIKFAAGSTGAGTATIGAANCPAVTAAGVFTWIKAVASDNSVIYIPAWK